MGDATIVTLCKSLITIAFNEHAENYIGYAEGMVGLGIMAGPVIGSILYTNLGYDKTFMCLSYLLVFNFLFTYTMMPSIANTNFGEKTQREEVADDKSLKIEDKSTKTGSEVQIYALSRNGEPKIIQKEYGYMDIIRCKRSLMALVGMFAAQTFSSFYEPVLSMRLQEFQLTEERIGYIFSISELMMSSSSFVIGYFTSRHLLNSFMVFGNLVQAFGLFLFGPSDFFELADNLTTIEVGYGIMGFSMSFIMTSSIPLCLNSICT